MMTNEGSVDRIIRVVLGGGALAGAFAVGAGSAAGIALLAVGAILLLTGAVGFCPLYRVLGVNTCPVPKR